jgi:hypothetical protein
MAGTMGNGHVMMGTFSLEMAALIFVHSSKDSLVRCLEDLEQGMSVLSQLQPLSVETEDWSLLRNVMTFKTRDNLSESY